MRSDRRPIVGIDLGTTYSAIAYVTDDGRAEIVRDLQDARTTPSVVFLDDERAMVGSAAREEALGFPDKVVALAKRVIGTDRTFTVNGREYTPQAISGFVLKKLKEDAERVLGHDATDAVVTVPAYFGLAQRKATEEACGFAGLNVRHIISEPTAAAIAFGLEQNRGARAGEPRTYLVYDLGGGTFDVTLLRITPTSGRIPQIEVLSTDGDSMLGGADWDRAMADRVLLAFRDEHGVDPSLDDGLMQSLLQKCEKAKFALATAKTSTVTCMYRDKTVKVAFDRDLLKGLTAPLLDRTLNLVDTLLAGKGVSPAEIDEVLLVGGSTKLVMVREALAERFGADRINTSLHPDLCVAQGAAWYGHLLGQADAAGGDAVAGGNGASRHDRVAAREAAANDRVAAVIGDICPFALGNAAVYKTGPGGEEKELVFTIIPKDSRLPCEQTGRFYTYSDDQQSVRFSVYENGSLKKQEATTLELSRLIASVVLEGLPPGRPAGQPLEVTYRLDPSFRLHVTGVDVKSGRRVETEVQYEFETSEAARRQAHDEVQATPVES